MAKNFLIVLIVLAFITQAHAQSLNDDLIKLAKAYRDFNFSNDPSKKALDELKIKSRELKTSREFIFESVRTNNKIATAKYLTRPDAITLKHLFTIQALTSRMSETEPVDYMVLIDSLHKSPPGTYEQVANYYGMLFTYIGNKNDHSNMSGVNFTVDKYGLKDDTEKGIFFLTGMHTFGMFIWGYMNIVNPPNFDKALQEISNYPASVVSG